MAIIHAAWVHGHAMEVEFADRVARELRAGFYFRLAGLPGTENWVHFAIPTPVIVSDHRLKVGQVLLRYRASGGALVHAVHVYDGESKIADHNGLNNHPAQWVMEHHDVPGDPDVRWGVGISIGVRFPRAPANQLPREILRAPSVQAALPGAELRVSPETVVGGVATSLSWGPHIDFAAAGCDFVGVAPQAPVVVARP
jgi:hypothetical protein